MPDEGKIQYPRLPREVQEQAMLAYWELLQLEEVEVRYGKVDREVTFKEDVRLHPNTAMLLYAEGLTEMHDDDETFTVNMRKLHKLATGEIESSQPDVLRFSELPKPRSGLR